MAGKDYKNNHFMDQEKKPGLFEEFPPVSTQEWEERIHADLKGADYEKRLVWRTNEGLKVRPYYRAEDLVDIAHMGVFPGEAPFVRGIKRGGNGWIIRQDFEEAQPDKANRLALDAIEKGADAIGLNAGDVSSKEDLQSLLEGIDPAKTAVHLFHGKSHARLLSYLTEIEGSYNIKGSLNFDPLGYFLLYDKFHGGRESDLGQARELIAVAKAQLPYFQTLVVNGQHIHNAGASVVQELAFALAQGNEYLANLTDMGLTADDLAPRMQFTFAIGSGYFLEIAKLRAVRMLWSKIVEQYKPRDIRAAGMNIHAVSSGWNKSVYDPYVNMLRTTTEAMSASIGGVDSMTVTPFDSSFRKPDEFSFRIARNQQIILKHEAYFGKVADPAAGSYYIEKLTDSVAHAAWALFLETEELGGFIKATEEGFIRSAIENTCQRRDMDIAMRKRVFVGTNLYPNTEERVLDKTGPTARLTDLSVLRQYRGTQAFEALRMAVENHSRKGFEVPKVFMFTYGNPAMREARAKFSANFFGVAGYQIIENLGFPDIGSGVRAALASEAAIVVLCSSDEEYAGMIPAATAIKEASPKTQVVVAGNPKDIKEQLVEAGVDHFIHVRTNALEALTRYNEILGVF